ncbi:MAG: CvpA family protein [Candidatus Omnitrophica bacterium]|nr:CvpA family protein [Candidatus Omnitrophota bacterium]
MSLPSNFNWIDLIAFIILVRIVYIAVNKGFIVEFFKLTATLLGIFFSFHFYKTVADFLVSKIPFLSKNLGYAVVFILFYLLVWTVIKYIRVVLVLLFKVEPHAVIERWFCLFFGLLRGIIFLSLLFYNLYLLNIEYLNKSLDGSLGFSFVKQVAPASYRMIGKVYKRIAPDFELKQETGGKDEITEDEAEKSV